jgi:hypothetical protein
MQSVMVDAALEFLRSQIAFFQGDWARSARLGIAASSNPNYVLDGAIYAAHAAVAGDLRDELRTAIEVHRASPLQGTVTGAAQAAAEAGLAAREGRWDDAHAGYQRALDATREAGFRLEEAFIGLEWGALAGSRDAEAAAAAAAGEAFFTERGGSSAVERYRAAFVAAAAAAVGAGARATGRE